MTIAIQRRKSLSNNGILMAYNSRVNIEQISVEICCINQLHLGELLKLLAM